MWGVGGGKWNNVRFGGEKGGDIWQLVRRGRLRDRAGERSLNGGRKT